MHLKNKTMIYDFFDNNPKKNNMVLFLNKIIRTDFLIGLFCLIVVQTASAQLATIGWGVLTSERPTELVAELHGATAPFAQFRAYTTFSWTDQSIKPTIITAAEKPVIQFGKAFTSLGAGLLWTEVNDYKPYSMLVSSTVIPLPVPQASLVFIGSTLPFQDFDWSFVVKVGWAFWFKE